LENLNKFIINKYREEPDKNNLIEIQLFGEEHTIGCMVATALQKCDYIIEAGYVMPHPFTNMIIIKYRLADKVKIGPIKVMTDVIAYLVRLFETISSVAFKV